MLGPVFTREAATAPRRPRHYLYRSVYVAALLILMCTAWLVLTGTQIIRDVGDMARFGSMLVDVVTQGEFLTEGARLEVIERRGNRVVVRAAS